MADSRSEQSVRNTLIESILVTFTSLALFLPFLSLQYDINGLIEASAVESGQIFHKNHMLYRIVGHIAYRGLQVTGYSGRAIVVLQTINAVCGALGVGLAYSTYKRAANNTPAALAGTLLFACSFICWLFSTDAAYITLAAMFAGASMAVLLQMRSPVRAVIAGVLTTLSILTWQASVFLIPALNVLSFQFRPHLSRQARLRDAAIYTGTACITSGLAYTFVGFAQDGIMSISSLVRWFASYGEGGTLPMWGKWEGQRVLIAAQTAVESILPTPLAIPVSQLTWDVQRSRVAVDLALVGFGLLSLLALLKARGTRATWFLVAYVFFLPFIVWWDPFEPKWFFIPNVFLAGFFAVALTPWFRNRYAAAAIVGLLLFIAATNFITTIRPRHKDVGLNRRIAECVAGNMHPGDLLIAAEWGWPDYIEYLYGRRSLSLISHFAALKDSLDEVRRAGGRAYMPDPDGYSDNHLVWLQSQSGVSREDLNRLADTSAFSCYGRRIFFVQER